MPVKKGSKYYIVFIIVCLGILNVSLYIQDYRIDEQRIIYHIVDPAQGKLKLYWKNASGIPYGSLGNLKKELAAQGQTLQFAMNGGMYMKDQSPQGLFIQEGKEKHTIVKQTKGYGNFYMQPNGVFYVTKEGKGVVAKSSDFKKSNNIHYATQSGPMLLIDGQYHPKFIKGSQNLHIRNGVGILPNGKLLFAMSKERINFYDLATFFKQRGCQNALYLDGFVSRTYLPAKGSYQLDGNFGVIIGEIE